MIRRLVDDYLAEFSLAPPNLAALQPNISEYNVLLCQPKGDLLVSATEICNRDRALAVEQFKGLLAIATQQATELVVAPEYAVPWTAVYEALLAGHAPPEGCLWALGCESITPDELSTLTQRLAGVALVLHENLNSRRRVPQLFSDPLAYVFRTRHQDGTDRLVILIQFKTHPSVDEDHIEIDGLILGSYVYMFGTAGVSIRLFSLICSDVFSTNLGNILEQCEATLILHIQLNPKPRESAYRSYRKHLFSRCGDNTELICLNWAAHIRCSTGNEASKDWRNIGGSAWYLRPDKFDRRDDTVARNHRGGLYYTWYPDLRCDVLFINYEPGAYHFRTSKVWHHGVPRVQSKRLGPRSSGVQIWDPVSGGWLSGSAEDGFQSLIHPHHTECEPLLRLYQRCPIAVERLLALLDRAALSGSSWHDIQTLKSCKIDEPELISRITFAQDPDEERMRFREERVQHFVNASRAVHEITEWPPELQDLALGYEWMWNANDPHSSVRSKGGIPATITYAGEITILDRLQDLGDALRKALLDSKHSPDRIGIVYRNNGVVSLWRHSVPRRFDLTQGSPTDFTDGG